MCAWSRGNSSHRRAFILYSHTASHATDTQLRLPLLPNHSLRSKAWNHSTDPLRQETDSQARSQNLSHTHTRSARYSVHFSPTYIFPKSWDRPRISHGPACTHRLRPAGKQKNKHTKTDTHKLLITESLLTLHAHMGWALCIICDTLTDRTPQVMQGYRQEFSRVLRRPCLFLYTDTLQQIKIGIWKCFGFSKLWHWDQRAVIKLAGAHMESLNIAFQVWS